MLTIEKNSNCPLCRTPLLTKNVIPLIYGISVTDCPEAQDLFEKMTDEEKKNVSKLQSTIIKQTQEIKQLEIHKVGLSQQKAELEKETTTQKITINKQLDELTQLKQRVKTLEQKNECKDYCIEQARDEKKHFLKEKEGLMNQI